MELRARILPFARRAAVTAALGAMFVPALPGIANADAAKRKKRYPVITSVRPMDVAVGETIEIRGRNFRRGRNKNTVVFKRDGARAVFVKAPLATRKLIRLQVPDKVMEFFGLQGGQPAPTRFRLRVLSARFSKAFTSDARSPLVGPPRPPKVVPPSAQPDGDCDGDGTANRLDLDDDNDLLDDATELSLGLDPCKGDTDEDGVEDRWEFDCDRDGALNRDESDDDADLMSDDLETRLSLNPCSVDTDGDGVEDGFEYRSAIDLNDDEYQDPNRSLPYPAPRPYPNPLFADGDVDYDGDSLTLSEEQALWKYTYTVTGTDPRSLDALSYSDGEQYTRSVKIASGPDAGRRQPTLSATNYNKHESFLAWATANGFRTVQLADGTPWWDHPLVRNSYALFDFNRDDVETNAERMYYDFDGDDFLSDNERDEDADGLTNYDESHGRLLPVFWETCYRNEKPFHIAYAGTRIDGADSDGDGILDGSDDQDHDDIPNVMEMSRYAASGFVDWDGAKGPCHPREEPPLPTDFHHSTVYGRVNPFNPCLPAIWSRTCPLHPNEDTGAPFDGSANWWSLQ